MYHREHPGSSQDCAEGLGHHNAEAVNAHDDLRHAHLAVQALLGSGPLGKLVLGLRGRGVPAEGWWRVREGPGAFDSHTGTRWRTSGCQVLVTRGSRRPPTRSGALGFLSGSSVA